MDLMLAARKKKDVSNTNPNVFTFLFAPVEIFTNGVITYVPPMHVSFSIYLKGGKHPVKIVFPLRLCETVGKKIL
jgi:hypothetical protein